MILRFKFSIISLFLLLSLQAQGQIKFTVEPRVGYGSFSMSDMRLVQKAISQGSEVGAKATDEFPSFFQYGLVVAYHVSEKSRISFVFEKGSTGGRVAYEDYSGSYTSDQLLQYNAFGSIIGRELPAGKLRFMFGLESTIMLTDLEIQEVLQVDGRNDRYKEIYEAVGFGFKPFVGLVYPYKMFDSRLTAGYLYNNNQPFNPLGDKDRVLTVNNQEVGPDWGGLRITFSVGFTIGQK